MINMFDFTDSVMTPMEFIVLQSEEYADKIIMTFKERWIGIGSPNEFLSDIADEIVPDAGDLLPASKTRIENTIKNYLEVFHA